MIKNTNKGWIVHIKRHWHGYFRCYGDAARFKRNYNCHGPTTTILGI